MKKLLLKILIITLSLSLLVGCSDKEKDNANEPTTNSSSTTSSKTSSELMEELKSNSFLLDGEPMQDGKFNDDISGFAFRAPYYGEITYPGYDGVCEVQYRKDILFTSLTRGKEATEPLKPSEIWTEVEERALSRLEPNFLNHKKAKLIMATQEDTVINEIECSQFEGTLQLTDSQGTTQDLYAVGYTFTIRNIPCVILGVVVDKNQFKHHKEEVAHNVLVMMQSMEEIGGETSSSSSEEPQS